jgi:hypothetical protein
MRLRVARDAAAGSWREWIRAQPALAAGVLLFCVVSIGGLWLALPGGLRSDRIVQEPTPGPPASAPEEPVSRIPGSPAGSPAAESEVSDGSGPWQWHSPGASSARGLALVYAYRTRPPGDDSRFDWYVRLVGPKAVLEDIDHVRWQMDPPPRDGAELISRNRAGDGFPLMGDGPGGWFGAVAVVRYKGGGEETLSRRIEMPEPEP